MARVLIVYHQHPTSQWRSTYQSHLTSFEQFSGHDCHYLNTAWHKVPKRFAALDPDLVIFHYTFLAVRQREIFEEHLERIAFIGNLTCPKALIPHDEQAHADLLCRVIRDFGVTHVFTPAAESEWRKIYAETDFDSLTFRTVLTGYVDDATVRKYARRSMRAHDRPIDVSYRSWSIQPSYGRHGQLKGEVGRLVKDRAPAFGLVADISSDYRDAFLGASWFDFLLKCKYTLGVEGGSSILDFDGSLSKRSREYLSAHEDATFEEIESACFPGRDGEFHYRLLGPRHLEAVLTRTCQVLIEGSYGGALEAGAHYIPLARDFSNLDDVLETMRRDDVREAIVERAYSDVIASGAWTYRAFADLVFATCLGEEAAPHPAGEGHTAVGVHTRAQARSIGGKVVWSLGRLWRTAAWKAGRAGHRIHWAMRLGLHRFLWGMRLAHGQVVRLGWLIRVGAQRVWLALARLWFEGGLGDFWWKLRHASQLPLRVLVRDTAVRLLGEERLWRLSIRAHNVIRRFRGQEALDLGGYVPSEAERARRQAVTPEEKPTGT